MCTWLHVHFCHRCLWCRYDVLLTANASVSNYWITVQPQYRLGSPNGFGVLRYEGAAPTLPQGPVPRPGSVKPWSISQIDKVTSSAYIVPCFLCFSLFYHYFFVFSLSACFVFLSLAFLHDVAPLCWHLQLLLAEQAFFACCYCYRYGVPPCVQSKAIVRLLVCL